MSFADDVKAAETVVVNLKAQDTDLHAKIKAAQASLDALLAQSVRDGVDVSQYQGDVDWTKVFAAADFALVKVADGDVLDPLYTTGRVTSIRQANGTFGPYYYARVASPGNGFRTPKTEAAMAYYFASKQGWGKAGDLPLVYDVEKSSSDSMSTFQGQPGDKAGAHVTGFVRAYRSLAGHYPMLYTNPDTWNLLGQYVDAAVLSKCPLWIAHYGVAAPAVPSMWSTWTFWQYTDKGTVDGISGNVDRNRANINKTDLDALRIA